MVYSIVFLGFMSFIVWAHHMFLTGMGTVMSSFFQTTTMIISIPSVIILTALIISLIYAALVGVALYWLIFRRLLDAPPLAGTVAKGAVEYSGNQETIQSIGEGAVDPYVAEREAYEQNRAYEIRNGDIPLPNIDDPLKQQ